MKEVTVREHSGLLQVIIWDSASLQEAGSWLPDWAPMFVLSVYARQVRRITGHEKKAQKFGQVSIIQTGKTAEVFSVQFSHDGGLLLTASMDGSARRNAFAWGFLSPALQFGGSPRCRRARKGW